MLLPISAIPALSLRPTRAIGRGRLVLACCLVPSLASLCAVDSQLPPTPAWQSHTVGVQKMLTIHADWPDVVGDEVSPDTSGKPYEAASAEYYTRQSYGRTTIESAPLLHIKMDINSTDGGNTGGFSRLSAAVYKAMDMGVDVSQYTRFRLMNPGPIGSSGRAYLGSKQLLGTHPQHELAHTYGNSHLGGDDIGVWLHSGAKHAMGWLPEEDPDGFGLKTHLSGTAEYDLIDEASLQKTPGAYRAVQLPKSDYNGDWQNPKNKVFLSVITTNPVTVSLYRGDTSDAFDALATPMAFS